LAVVVLEDDRRPDARDLFSKIVAAAGDPFALVPLGDDNYARTGALHALLCARSDNATKAVTLPAGMRHDGRDEGDSRCDNAIFEIPSSFLPTNCLEDVQCRVGQRRKPAEARRHIGLEQWPRALCQFLAIVLARLFF
jgi:hypothetical protein